MNININIIGLAMYVMRFEVTTPASGDVKRQTLVFFLGLWKGRIFFGCGLMGVVRP